MVKIETILVPVDSSDNAWRAAVAAGHLADRLQARVVLCHVMSDVGSGRVPPELQSYAKIEHIQINEGEALTAAANDLVQAAAKQVREDHDVPIETVVLTGDPGEAIVDYVRDHDIDLVVMGRRGLGSLAGLLMGSVSSKVAHLAPCPCLTVP